MEANTKPDDTNTVVVEDECESCMGNGVIREADKTTRKCLDCSGTGNVAKRIDLPSDVVVCAIHPGDKEISLTARNDDWQSFQVTVSRDDCNTSIAEAVARRLALAYNAHATTVDALKHALAFRELDLADRAFVGAHNTDSVCVRLRAAIAKAGGAA